VLMAHGGRGRGTPPVGGRPETWWWASIRHWLITTVTAGAARRPLTRRAALCPRRP